MSSVKIVAMSQPVDLDRNGEEIHDEGKQTLMSTEEFVAYAARVSNPTNQINNETAPKLLKYLLDHKHFSPFEMVSITMEIVTTRDIARQILRHRSFSFQEFSQRYANPTKDLGFVIREARLQDPKNRQNSLSNADQDLKNAWDEYQELVTERSLAAYDWAIENGIAKEQARAVLPEGLTVSKLYMAGSLRSWIHYCQLRCANGTQKEHQEIALAAWKCLISKLPTLCNLFIEVPGTFHD